ncbi:conserved oligomeric golgi complex subunit 2 [Phtheirospermum japonicum]|uniref:Conserved oligomeric Golgi complex subunit 2 n=1 Tax=Phtheirospermum japonicum TaxID=374723 RepID=A0A830BPI0_9LAMI|nr:conserved oligomeric golgi complex subunit 2 [Phtheirospermum japonicum]
MATDLLSPLPKSTTDLFGDPIEDSHPLWLNPSKFSDPEFDTESYISDLRTFVPFDTLRLELRSHLGALKHELVELINRDYADFVSLSTKLVDVDAAVVRMRAPLLEIKEKILAFRGSVDGSLAALQIRLKQRSQANEAREVLELLLDTFHVVSKVEKLIKELPTVTADWPKGTMNPTEKLQLSNGISFQHAENGTNLRETQSMLLERIASEMNRLKFYIAHAQNMPFIENMVKRTQNASLLLDTSLGHCFENGLEHRDENAIYNCLRAYAAIDNTSSAEEIFRSTVVAPFIQKIIPHGSSKAVGGSSGDELEQDYERIKRHIEEDCKFLLEISFTGLHVFSFLTNSILKEVLSAIQKGKPGALSPGRPTEFLKNYKASLGFLDYLEDYCLSRSGVVKLREEPVYIEFIKLWNTGVYYSLRFQEIAGALDSALIMTTTLVPSQNSNQEYSQSLVLKQSITLMDCLKSCWRDDVLLIACSDKFLRLFLQLLSRYSNWLSAGLNARKAGNASATSGSEWAISAASDDFLYVIHDLNCLVEEVCGDYLGHVLGLLKSCSPLVLDLVKQSILQGGNSLKALQPLVINSIVESLVEKSVEDLRQLKGITATYRMTNKPLPVRHSPYVSGVLRPLKLEGVRLVEGIMDVRRWKLDPSGAFLEGERAATYLTRELKQELLQGAAFEITRRYYELASDLVSVARKTESSLQKIRLGAQRRAGASSDVSDHNVSDTDKICMQLFLDIQEYGRNLASLGIDAANIPEYRSLWQCVAPSDRQNTISF